MYNSAKNIRLIMNIKGDIAGGLTAGIIALPLSLAFGIASGLGAAAGLYGAIVLGFFAALFGGTKTQISGPTGPMTVVAASIILPLGGDIASVMAVFVLAGLIQIGFGVIRIGRYIKFIPYPVISGFMSGVGVIIILLQLNPMLGSEGAGNTLKALMELPGALMHIDLSSFGLAIATIAILYLTPKKLASIVPTPLLAIIVLTPLAAFMALDVKMIGAIPTGLPEIIIPSFDIAKVSIIVSYAAMLAVLGAIDSLLTSLVADSITRTKHNSDKELIGQGIGNALLGFVGGIPGAGATMRTVINIKTGGTTNRSGMIHALFLLLVLLFLGSYASHIPLAVLSGILIKVGLDILDYRLLTRISHAPRHDLYVMGIVFFLTVFVDLIFAVGVGIVASSLLLVYRISRESGADIFDSEPESSAQDDRIRDGVRVVNINGPFFFGSMSQVVERTQEALDVRTLVIDCSRVPFLDLSAIYALEEIILTQQEKGQAVYTVFNPKQLEDKTLSPILGIVGEKVFTDQKSAVDHALKA